MEFEVKNTSNLKMVTTTSSKNGNHDQKLQTKMSALVVDDDAMIRRIHRKVLENHGIENQEVRNGKEAIEIICSGRKFELILMDRDMPVMNGIEATKQLRDMGIRSTIAGVSTRSSSSEVQEFMEAGLDDFQEKPLTPAKLKNILDNIKYKASVS
ncbi:two-component response regulator 24-like [Mercurialis annua]|uniref:two-component response regulator 24-like n=1 Tax=Mercurialis annua TaxID=3986 RepID=UPI0021608690|nr:two-component response regulator 24-like [Mercurialis annua]